MYLNTTGNTNTAVGSSALFNNVSGYNNVAIGVSALHSTTNDYEEVAIGDSAMFHMNGDEPPDENTAIGSKALYSESGTSRSGYENTAIGYQSLYTQNSGYFNTAVGDRAGSEITTGNDNTIVGSVAMASTTSGSYNTFIGSVAGFTNTVGADNTELGFATDANANNLDNAAALGFGAFSTASNQVRIGDNSVTSIGGYAGWTNISDGRVKKNIKQNVPGLAFINQLQPVTYNFDLDAADKIVQSAVIRGKDGKPIQPSQEELAARTAKEQIVYTGFIAQDVEKAAKSLNYDFSGVDAAKNDKDLYGLRYAEFVVPLVKAVQELSAANDNKQNQIDSLISMNTALNNRLTKIEAVLDLNQSAAAQASVSISSASLEQNTPNPYSNSTTVYYTLPAGFTSAQIVITDNTGKTLKQLIISGQGRNSVKIDAAALSSGSYNYSLLIDGRLIDTKKMVLTK